MAQTLFRASIPSISKLCYVVAQIDVSEIKDSSAKSNFHWKTMKCRLIIHTMQDNVIASPVYQTISSIHVVTSVEFFKSEALQNNLKEMNMTWSPPKPVTLDVYASCLRYSILFALAPRWNKVGQYLINDQYFLTCPGTFAMRFNLSISTGSEQRAESILKLQPLKVQMCNLKLEDLKIPQEVIAHFMADPQGVIDVASFGTIRATVLPSLKRGRIIKVLKSLPASSPFKNYGELRRHWKNMYGYRLPKIDNDLIFYEIIFPVAFGDRFIYPDICVRSQILERPYLGNSEEPIHTLVRDLNETIPLVCGEYFRISGENHSMTNPSTAFLDDNKFRKDSASTPENPSRLQGFREYFRHTSRFSFSCGKNKLCKEPSTLMSPTPSLRGHFQSPMRNEKFRNILTNHVTDNNDAIVTSRLPRINDYSSELQNRCPNFDDSSSNDSRETLDDRQDTKPENLGDEMTFPVEMNFLEARTFLPGGSSESPQIYTGNTILPTLLEQSSSVKSCDKTVKRKKQTIMKNEIISKYFVKSGERKIETKEKMNSPLLSTSTLSQKLKRNLDSTKKTVDDD